MRFIALASLGLLLFGCQALKPKPTIDGTWNIGGDKFVIEGVEKASGKATYAGGRVTFDVVMDLTQSQGTINLKVEGTYDFDGENYRHRIERMTPDISRVAPALQELAKAQLESAQVRALLNQAGTAKAKFESETLVKITGSDGKTLELRKA